MKAKRLPSSWRLSIFVVLVTSWCAGCAYLLDIDGRLPVLPPPGEALDAALSDSAPRNEADVATEATDPTDAATVDSAVRSGIVFVTSSKRQADMMAADGGSPTVAADAWCEELASASSQLAGKKWIAWLSEPDAGVRERFPKSRTVLEYRRVDGILIFPSGFPEVPLVPLKPINIDENGALLPFGTKAWTQTGALGQVFIPEGSCGGWRSAGGSFFQFGIAGDPYSIDDWTYGALQNCPTESAVYCFEIQKPP